MTPSMMIGTNDPNKVRQHIQSERLEYAAMTQALGSFLRAAYPHAAKEADLLADAVFNVFDASADRKLALITEHEKQSEELRLKHGPKPEHLVDLCTRRDEIQTQIADLSTADQSLPEMEAGRKMMLYSLSTNS